MAQLNSNQLSNEYYLNGARPRPVHSDQSGVSRLFDGAVVHLFAGIFNLKLYFLTVI
jgi:hypothetical protein